VVSDDGSTDDTVELVNGFGAAEEEACVRLRLGPRARSVGSQDVVDEREYATANFLSLVRDEQVEGDYFAYSDQDDIWAPDKLARAVAWLSSVPASLPALYCSRTQHIDEQGRPCGLSPLFAKPPGFRNALVQNIAGGNTMVFNRAARDLLAKTGPVQPPAHDWWTYILVTGSGGLVHYDPMPSVRYRQHEQNIVGANQGALAMARRARMVAAGGWAKWTDLNLKALSSAVHLLTPENRRLVEELAMRRNGSMVARVRALARLGLYRQTTYGQLTLHLAAIGGRL
jgi:hypothetical protein